MSETSSPIQRDQRIIVRNLNKYLESQDLSFRLETSGVCRGLALVRCKYILEGREDEYYAMLDRISNLKNMSADIEITHFANDILVAFAPNLFDSSKEQKDAVSNFKIAGKPLKTSLKVNMITSDIGWTSTFDAINLQKDEVMLLGSPTHAWSVSRLPDEQGYRLADPNDPQGYVDYQDSTALVGAIHTIASTYGWQGDLGLDLEIVRHPKASPRSPPLPSAKQIYNAFMDLQSQFADKAGLQEWDQLKYLCRSDNTDGIEVLFQTSNPKPTDKELIKGLALAVSYNSSKTIKFFLDNPSPYLQQVMQTQQTSESFFNAAIKDGKYGSFQALAQHALTHPYYLSMLTQKNATALIHNAATGGSLEILQKLISDFTQNATPPLPLSELAKTIKSKIKGEDAIEAAIGKKGECGTSNTQCISQLLDILQKTNKMPDDLTLQHYLLKAIETNQPHLVKLFCDTIKTLPSKHQELLFKSISLTPTTARKTDYSVLKELEKASIDLSGVRGVMKEKAGNATGVLDSIGDKLCKFNNWLGGVTAANNMSYCKHRLKELKEKASDENNPTTNNSLP